MGKALSTDLISKGWNVACLDLNEQEGLKVAQELGGGAKFFKCRVDNYDEQAQAFQAVYDTWGRLDAALLNAGIVDRTSIYMLKERNIHGLPPKPDLSCTDVCWNGFVYGTVLAIHFMRKNPTPGGQIIATASAWAHFGVATAPEYSGAKAAVSIKGARFCCKHFSEAFLSQIIEFTRAAAPVLKVVSCLGLCYAP